MKSKFKINKPCPENWYGMPEISGGRFCDICAKKVWDLDGKSEDEMGLLLKNNPGMCGKISINKNLMTTLSLVLTLTFSSCTTKQVSSHPISQTSANFVSLSGIITKNYTKQGVPNAQVNLVTKDKIYRTNTDENGDFKLNIPENLLKKTILLSINYQKIPLEKKEMLFQSSENIVVPEVDLDKPIKIKFHNYMSMGGVAIAEKSEKFYVNGKKVSEKSFRNLVKESSSFTIYTDREDEIRAIFGYKPTDKIRIYFSDSFIVSQ